MTDAELIDELIRLYESSHKPGHAGGNMRDIFWDLLSANVGRVLDILAERKSSIR